MATNPKILGQLKPAAAALSVIYTVPSGKKVTARLMVCNQSGAADSFRVALSKAGASIAVAHYIAFGQSIDANDAVSSVAFGLAATDVVRVYSANGDCSFTLSGLEADL